MKIKKITKKDAERLRDFMNNKTILKEICYYKGKYDIRDAKKELEKNKKYKFGIFEENKIIGRIEITPKNNPRIFAIEYIISPSYRKRGIATWGMKEICKKAFSEFKAIRIHARVLTENKVSQKILQKCGFKLEGHLKKSFYINKKYKDELIFGKTK